MFNKELAVSTLVDDDLNTILAYQDDNWILSEILQNGFTGYINYSDDELMQELKERGLEEGFGI